jgi:hypothetical protein
VLLYRGDAPLLFRDGDLVFLMPDAVVGIIEVKSRLTTRNFNNALEKFSVIGTKLGSERSRCFFGLFSYESDIRDHRVILGQLQNTCDHSAKIVDLMSLGCSTFRRWWKMRPEGGTAHYERWHSYDLEHMSAGYFIANVVDFVSPESVARNDWLWFPETGKESKKTGAIASRFALNG